MHSLIYLFIIFIILIIFNKKIPEKYDNAVLEITKNKHKNNVEKIGNKYMKK